ncbi:RNA-binding S4 domain-containing protein [Conexibacter sp. CPCC 206217]|uniref:RNA-binding S4 domain-containing protein n=1 Tax=Conexibacter sp. CPCC 206217 TaxID=3064574 RepID=UPI00271D5FE6|nr:RNA-binding S4 domain-containing protein [Conexibacter sp. CPCC 206217]MDO8209047.1 RNA-binding S4 domain-containing protein [Conexibacter sp. CPCC 206217]
MTTKREPVSVDTWLWAARLVKTRAQALEAIEAGHVHVNGATAAADTKVGAGDTLELHVGEGRIAVDVRGVATLRGPERIAARLYEETDESAAEHDDEQTVARRAAVPRLSAAQAGLGSTKRDRRVSEQSANARRVAPRGGGRGR